MTDTITIPPEAVEAAVRTHMNLNLATRERAMDAAIRAALAAWPGMMHRPDHLHWPEWPHIILPLNTENPDAET